MRKSRENSKNLATIQYCIYAHKHAHTLELDRSALGALLIIPGTCTVQAFVLFLYICALLKLVCLFWHVCLIRISMCVSFTSTRLLDLKTFCCKTIRLENELVALNFGFDIISNNIKFPRFGQFLPEFTQKENRHD